MAFVKVYDRLLASSVWEEPLHVRVAWVSVLLLADRQGLVEGTVGSLARRANLPREQMEEALGIFLAPDPDSRTPDEDGRRLLPMQGGWRVVNYEAYRTRPDPDETRKQTALRVARYRERQADPGNAPVTPGNACNGVVTPGNANAEAEAEAEAESSCPASSTQDHEKAAPPASQPEKKSSRPRKEPLDPEETLFVEWFVARTNEVHPQAQVSRPLEKGQCQAVHSMRSSPRSWEDWRALAEFAWSSEFWASVVVLPRDLLSNAPKIAAKMSTVPQAAQPSGPMHEGEPLTRETFDRLVVERVRRIERDRIYGEGPPEDGRSVHQLARDELRQRFGVDW